MNEHSQTELFHDGRNGDTPGTPEAAPPPRDSPVLQDTPPDRAQGPPARHPRPRRPHLTPLPPKVRMGHDVQGSQPSAPALPTGRQDLPLRDILQGLGPDMVATACHGINALTETARAAIEAGNLVVRLMAERTVAQEGRKWTELALGRTLNINTNIKSQRDLLRLDKLSTEKRAQLQTLLTELTTDEIIDVEFADDAITRTTDTAG